MSEQIKKMLVQANLEASKFDQQLRDLSEDVIKSAQVVEVTEEMEILYNDVLQVLLDSDLPVESIVGVVGLVGMEAEFIIRDLKKD